jgi:hypothetical protein
MPPRVRQEITAGREGKCPSAAGQMTEQPSGAEGGGLVGSERSPAGSRRNWRRSGLRDDGRIYEARPARSPRHLRALAFVVAPLAVEAQRVFRIGMLSMAARPPDISTYPPGFISGLRALRWVEGQHYVLEYRFADGRARLPVLAAELVALPVDVIVAVFDSHGAGRQGGRSANSRAI